ncbi:MAG: hypothetical protein ACKO4W_15365, partial [Bacteroidota bacterium]
MKQTTAAFIFAFWAISGFFSPLCAQAPAKFPETPNEFVAKLGEFMTQNKRPDMEESFAVFNKMYKSGIFRDDDIKRIIRLSNLLGAQNLAPFPYYKNYIDAVTGAKSDPDTALFTRWHTFSETVIAGIEKGRTKPIGQYLEFSSDMMNGKALKSGEGGSVTWKIKGGSVSYEYTDKTPRIVCNEIDLIGARKTDSVVIMKTSGAYLPYDNVWRGKGGRVSWAEAGMDSSIYAVLGNYKIETNKPLFN